MLRQLVSSATAGKLPALGPPVGKVAGLLPGSPILVSKVHLLSAIKQLTCQ
jgi:hypothetical protein